MAQIGRYMYSVDLTFVGKDNQTIQIPSASIVYIIIDYDYENLSMPIIYIKMNINSTLYNTVVLQYDIAKFSLTISKSDTNSSSAMSTDYIRDLFKYFVPNNPNYTKDLDESVEGVMPDQSYKQITIGLLKMDLVNYNRRITNQIFKNTNMISIIHKCTAHMPMVVEPFIYNDNIDTLILPPMDNVRSSIEFLNDYKSFYDTGYRFFIDFDRTYLLSNSGNYIDAGDGSYSSITFDIKGTGMVTSQQPGMIKDNDNRSYVIYADALTTNVSLNKVTEKIANHIIGVTTDGDIIECDLNINNTDADVRNIFCRIPNDNKNYINNMKSDLETTAVRISIEKTELDSSIITPNRSYTISNFEDYSSYNGKFLLAQKKEMLLQKDGRFMSATVISLKKV